MEKQDEDSSSGTYPLYGMQRRHSRTPPPSEASYAIPRIKPISLSPEESTSYQTLADDDFPRQRPWDRQRQSQLSRPSDLYPHNYGDSFTAPSPRTEPSFVQQPDVSNSRPLSFPGEYDINSPVTGGIRVLPPVRMV